MSGVLTILDPLEQEKAGKGSMHSNLWEQTNKLWRFRPSGI